MYVGEHPSPVSTNRMRAEEEVRRETGNSEYKARQVIVVTWHEVSPLVATLFAALRLPFYVSLCQSGIVGVGGGGGSKSFVSLRSLEFDKPFCK